MPNPDKPQPLPEIGPRLKVTARISLAAYDAIAEIQRRHRTQTGRVLPLWKVLDTAITAYAETQGIPTRE